MQIETIKIKPSHPSQGDYVVINADDFDAHKHEKIEQAPEGVKRGRKTAQPQEAE
jgi:hypothetical protein